MRVPYDADDAVRQLSSGLTQVFRSCSGRPIVIVCVGTDRSTGDVFGPIIGARLQENLNHPRISIYGTLDNPVHAVNLSTKLEDIHHIHKSSNPVLIAIDACLGNFEHVGQIVLEKGPLRPGAGVKKTLPEFGSYTITGVVNVAGFMEYFVLQNTRLGIVMKMTEVVVEALLDSIRLWVPRATDQQPARERKL
ncbi:spore protease YyaC [Alicyclobacillus sp. SO9]|nr:spore protease YyaC [Alicyclobacillus sp. SO9]